MLIQLAIRDIVLIDKLELHFREGLSVLTGETGAGKSILLDAFALALGGRGDGSLVRHGEAQGQITAVFDCPIDHPARLIGQDQIERQFNKVSMVTLWIDPAESQIVRYDFENLGLDFFPGQWLVRVGETSASMTMGRYFDGVWLPKAIVMKGDLQVAIGSFDIDYRREFLEYRKAETSARIRGYGDVK